MAASLSQEQGLELVKRLADDDGFRELFQKDPKAALLQIGVSEGLMAGLKAECFQQKTLADKQIFAKLVDDLNSDQFKTTMSMWIPTVAVR